MHEDSTPVCPLFKACPLFARFRHSGTIAVFRINYCLGQHARCARDQAWARGEQVSDALLPGGASLKVRLTR